MADYPQYGMTEDYVNKFFVWVFTDPLRWLKNKCGTNPRAKKNTSKFFNKCEFKLSIRHSVLAAPGVVKLDSFSSCYIRNSSHFLQTSLSETNIHKSDAPMACDNSVRSRRNTSRSWRFVCVCYTTEKRVWMANGR